MKDEYVPARESALGAYRAGFLKAIDKALLMNVEARPQSVAAWRGDVLAPDPPKQSWLSRGRGAKQQAEAMELAGVGAPPAIPASGLIPPPPDAPGVQGGFLDFFDILRGKAADQPATPPAVDEPPPPAKSKPAAKAKPKLEAKAAELKAKGKSKAKTPEPPAKSAPAAKAAAVKTERATPARPRPVHGGAKPRRIGVITKLAMAAAVAGGVVLFQNQLPKAPAPSKAAIVLPLDIPVMLREFKAHDTAVNGVAFAPDGRTIVSVSRDATLKIWNAASGGLQKSVPLDNRLVTSLALAGRRAVTGHGDGTAVLYDLDRGERVASFKRNDADIWAVAFLGNQDRFATASHDYITTVWETKNTAAPQFTLEGHESAAQAVAYSEHGPWIATGSADMTVRLYDVDTHDLQRVYKGAKDFVTGLAFSPDGKSLAVASLDGSIRIYSTTSSRLQKQLTGHKSRIGALAFSPDGNILASAADEGIVRLWDARRGRTMRSLGGHAGGAKSVSFSPDGTKLASSGADGMIRLWSVPSVKTRD